MMNTTGNSAVTCNVHGHENTNDIVEPKKAKMEGKYSSPPVQVTQQTQQNMNASGLNASTRSSSPNLELTIHGMERDKDRATYLQQLIKDQKCCLSYPNVFHHVERLLSEGMLTLCWLQDADVPELNSVEFLRGCVLLTYAFSKYKIGIRAPLKMYYK